MIKLLIKKFIKDYENTNDKFVRESYGVLSGVVGILCNIFLFILKLSIGLFINSIAVISDAFNNLTDLGSSLIAIIGAKMSNKPPDPEHPHGHGRFEYISSLAVSFIIFFVGLQLFGTSFKKILQPEKVLFSPLSIVILTLSISIKLWMYSYNRYIGKAINSSINKATAQDSLNDVIATSAVIITTVIGNFIDFSIDGIVGVVISLIILYSGFEIAKDTINLLLGSSPDPELVNTIEALVSEGKHIIGTHDLKVHDYGPGRVVASIHAEVPDKSNIVEIHSVIDELEEKIARELGINMVIHMDPISTDIHRINEIHTDITHILQGINETFRADHLRIADGEARTNIIFDLVVPSNISSAEHDSIIALVSEQIGQLNGNFHTVVNIVTL